MMTIDSTRSPFYTTMLDAVASKGFRTDVEKAAQLIASKEETVASPDPVVEDVVEVAPVVEVPATPDVVMPSFYMYKGRRIELVPDTRVASYCAHCGMELKDALSIERCLGPVCSKRGYTEDPTERSDELQAMIDLAEYPTLVDYLVAKYKPLGVRPLMNGLLKIAALNRKSPGLHGSICDAIESLGWPKLAALLRTSIATVEIRVSKARPDHYAVWVQKEVNSMAWYRTLCRVAGIGYGHRLQKAEGRGLLIPMSCKRGLWEAMLSFFPGDIARTPAGTIKISRETTSPSQPPPAVEALPDVQNVSSCCKHPRLRPRPKPNDQKEFFLVFSVC